MALIPPMYDDYVEFLNEEFPDDMIARIEDMMVQATDAFWVFTGLSDYPDDPRAARIARYAIMELTSWLLSQHENRAEINSPFSSERIGSYSYSKMQRAKEDFSSGLYWLDLFFRWLSGNETASQVSVSSENVFSPQGYTFEEQEFLRSHDKFYGGGFF